MCCCGNFVTFVLCKVKFLFLKQIILLSNILGWILLDSNIFSKTHTMFLLKISIHLLIYLCTILFWIKVISAYFGSYFRMTTHGCRFFAYFEKWLFLTSLFHLTAVSFERWALNFTLSSFIKEILNKTHS